MVVCLFCNKTSNYSEENSLFKQVSVVLIQFLRGGWEREGGWGEGGRLFEFEWERKGDGVGVGAYSRWALIQGCALIRINTVLNETYLILTSKSEFLTFIPRPLVN